MFKTNYMRAGIDPAWRNVLLGHRQAEIGNHFIKPRKEDLQNAMDKDTR
jgi:hypothetical protein